MYGKRYCATFALLPLLMTIRRAASKRANAAIRRR
jgi:hypothetical protein